MQEKIDALKKEIEALNERIEGLEAQLEDVSCSIPNGDVLIDVENVLEFSFLDNFPEHTDENIIILHTDPYRTYNLINSCKSSCGRRQNMYGMNEIYCTPGFFRESLLRAQKGQYIALRGDVFDISDEFETLILEAISLGEVFFIILTNDLSKIPQSIHEKMRVIQ